MNPTQKQFSLNRAASRKQIPISNAANGHFMRNLMLAIPLALLATLTSVFADSERYVTVTINPSIYATNGANYSWGATNTIDIAEGETGELICTESGSSSANVIPNAFVTKNAVTVYARPASFITSSVQGITPRGTTVAGPATFTLLASYQASSATSDYSKGALMTVKISPMTFAPEKTVTVAPGMGSVQIDMESSTNLVQWATATNGVYSDSLRFFRVKLTKLTP